MLQRGFQVQRPHAGSFSWISGELGGLQRLRDLRGRARARRRRASGETVNITRNMDPLSFTFIVVAPGGW